MRRWFSPPVIRSVAAIVVEADAGIVRTKADPPEADPQISTDYTDFEFGGLVEWLSFVKPRVNQET